MAIFDDSDEPEPVATYNNIFMATLPPSTTGGMAPGTGRVPTPAGPTPTQAQWVAAIAALNPGLPGSPTPKRGSGFYSGDEATLVPGKLRGYRCWAVRWPEWVKVSPPVRMTAAGAREALYWKPEYRSPVGLRPGRHAGDLWSPADARLVGRVAPEPWEPKPTAAQCHREDLVRRHVWSLGVGESATHPEGQPIPAQDCSCGWYAVHSPHDDELSTYGCPCPGCASAALPVRGVVEGWGRVQLGPRGWRAPHARIVALYLPSPAPVEWVTIGDLPSVAASMCPLAAAATEGLATGLGKAYGVPVFRRWEHLLAVFPPIDTANLGVSEESKGTPGNE